MDTHYPPQWKQRLLAMINSHGWDIGAFAKEPTRLLLAWGLAEGGTARWNPLNTTLTLSGSTDYNSSGVKNYFRPTEGVCATALTLVNGHYNGILGDLQSGIKTAEQIVEDRRAQFGVWGTNPDTILSVLKGV